LKDGGEKKDDIKQATGCRNSEETVMKWKAAGDWVKPHKRGATEACKKFEGGSGRRRNRQKGRMKRRGKIPKYIHPAWAPKEEEQKSQARHSNRGPREKQL